MKAFKKWNKNNPTKYALEECGRKDGWKAALEMVKREIFEHRDALDVIEEELEQ